MKSCQSKLSSTLGCLVTAVVFFAAAGGYVKLANTYPLIGQVWFIVALLGIPICWLAYRRYKAGYYDVE